MTKEAFLELLAETIDTEDRLNENTLLDDIDEYDSIAVLTLMSMYDDLGIKIVPDNFKNLQKISDLIKLAGEKIA